MTDKEYKPKFYSRDELKGKCGVYQLRNLESGKIYVGSSKQLSDRWKSHERDLKANKHANPHLQRAYNKTNGNFIFEVIEFCSEAEQYLYEQYWIDKFIKDSYNINPSAVKPPDCTGKKTKPLTLEQRKRMSEQRKKWYQEHPEFRKKMSEERIGKRMGKDHINSKTVICIETGVEYAAINEAGRETGIDRRLISACCRHKYHESNGFHFMFKKEYEQMSKKDIEEYLFETNSRTQIVCLETRELYEGIVRASQITGIHRDSIGRCCSGKLVTAGGFHWVYYNEFKKMSEDKIIEMLKVSGDKRRKVICITTGKVYNSISDAGRDLGVSSSKITCCCQGTRKRTLGYEFEYYDDPNDDRIFRPRNTSNVPKKPVQCVETSKIYPSIAEASRKTGICEPSIGKCCKGKQQTAGGFHWEYI